MTYTAYTPNQELYIDAFMRHSDKVLEHFLETGLAPDKSGGSIGDVLEMASSAVDGLQNMVALAGAFTVVVSGGTVLPAIAAGLGVAKLGEEAVKFVWTHANPGDAPFAAKESDENDIRLDLYILLREVARKTAVRYRHFIDKLILDDSRDEFPKCGVERVVEKLGEDLKKQNVLPPTLKADSLVDFLLSSVTVALVHEQRQVTTKEHPKAGSWLSGEALAKWAFARGRRVVIDDKGKKKFYASSAEKQHINKATTLLEYGYIAMSEAEFKSTASAVKHNELRELKEAEITDKAQLEDDLGFDYPVSRDEVEAYLKSVRALDPSKDTIPSLNEYLYNKYKVHYIAVCHDAVTLAGLDLSGGNFSYVDFSRANLGGCNLRNTVWEHAHLIYAQFERNDLTDVNFQHAYLERSTWTNLELTGNFSQSRQSGATFTDVTILSDYLFVDSRMDQVRMIRCKTDNPNVSLQDHFESALNREHQEREKAIAELAARVGVLETAQAALQSDITENAGKIAALEVKQAMLNEEMKQFKHREEVQDVENVLGALLDYQEKEINTPSFREAGKRYVEPDVLASDGTRIPVSQRLDQALQDKKNQFFLVKGVTGSSKTETACLWSEEAVFVSDKPDETKAIKPKVLYIKCKRLRDPSVDNFLYAGLQTILTKEQIHTLMDEFPCVIILDGVDECPYYDQRNILQECIELNEKWKHGPPKIIMFAETRALHEKDYHEILRLDPETTFPVELECELQPYTEEQASSYRSLYEKKDPGFAERYAILQESEPAIREMAKSPLMLHIICEVLCLPAAGNRLAPMSCSHGLSEGLTAGSSDLVPEQEPWIPRTSRGSGTTVREDKLPSSRIEFYDAFFLKWFEHVRSKRPDLQVDYDDFQGYVQEMAMSMFESHKDYVDRTYPQKNHKPFKSAHAKKNNVNQLIHPVELLFEDPQFGETRHLTPLSMTEHRDGAAISGMAQSKVLRYEFTHISFEHYALAKQLLSILLDPEKTLEEQLADWNHGFLTDSPEVLDFLYDLLHKHLGNKIAQSRLIEMVLASKGEDGKVFGAAASNAITLLSRLGYDFTNNIVNPEFENIHVPNADINRSPMAYVSLKNSDLTGVSSHETLWLHSDLEDATVSKIRFLNAQSFMYLDVPPETFAVCPSASDDRVAFDVTPKSTKQKYKIAIAQASDGMELVQWDAHQGKVRCMAWTTSGGYNRLASAGEGGTVRVWDMSDKTGPGKQIAMLQVSARAILTLAWADDGNLLAFGGEDKTVQIWNINKKTRCFESEIHGPGLGVNGLIWGNRSNLLISGADDSMLRIWSVSRETGQASELNKVSLVKTRSEGNPGSIYGLALSPDGKQLAAGCANGRIYYKDIFSIISNDETPFNQLTGHKDAVTSLTWPKEGLISASDDGTVRHWANQRCKSILDVHENRIKQVVVLPNGRYVMSGGGSRGRLLSISIIIQQTAMSSKHEYMAHVSCLAAREDMLAVGGMDGRVFLRKVNAMDSAQDNILLTRHDAPVRQIVWSNDGKYLASLANKGHDKTIRIRQIGQLEKQWGVLKIAGEGKCFNCMTWLTGPNHQHWLAAGSSNGSIYLWDIDQISMRDPGEGVLFQPHILIKDITIKDADWSFMGGAKTKEIVQSFMGGIQSLACAPEPNPQDPNIMRLAASSGKMVTILALPMDKTYIEVRIARTIEDRVNEEWVLLDDWTTGDGNILEQRILMKAPVERQFKHPERPAISLAWSPDGRFLASGNDNGNVYIWNTDTWVSVPLPDELSEHKQVLWAMVEGNQWLVSGNPDTITIWDASANNPVWNEPKKQVSWGAGVLALHNKNLVMARNKGIYAMPFLQVVNTAGDSVSHPSVKIINPGFWAQKINLKKTKELHPSTERFMHKQGAVTSIKPEVISIKFSARLLRGIGLYKSGHKLDANQTVTLSAPSQDNGDEANGNDRKLDKTGSFRGRII